MRIGTSVERRSADGVVGGLGQLVVLKGCWSRLLIMGVSRKTNTGTWRTWPTRWINAVLILILSIGPRT